MNEVREPDINDVLAEYLDRMARGEPATTQEYLARHPGLSRELAAHFETLSELDALLVTDPAYPVANQHLGDHRLLSMLGRGGMGVVYLAERLRDQRIVALKVLGSVLTQSRESLERFRRESAIARRLSHPNLIAVHELVESQGYTYFTMEYVPGITLARVIQRMRELRADGIPDPSLVRVVHELAEGPEGAARDVPAEDRFASAARIAAALADALDHAHAAGVIHRDVKPQNVLIGGDLRPKLGDFGLAKDSSLESLSRAGSRLGTAHYMSPEMVAMDGARVDHRTDIYSLGATLYELLTLDLPFRGDSVEEVFRRITLDAPRSLTRLDPRIPKPLQAITLKALEKNPARRYRSCGEMAEELRRYLRSEPIRTRMPPRIRRLFGAVRRHPRWLAAAAVVLVAAVTAVVAPRVVEGQRRGTVVREAREHVAAGRHRDALALLIPLERGDDPGVTALIRTARGDQTLLILPETVVGELSILTLPGESAARTIRLAGRTHVDLEPGDHLLTARLPGDQVSEHHVTVRRGEPLPAWTIAPMAAAGPPPGMVRVPAGTYEIGEPPSGPSTFARTHRRVDVRAFYLDANEVTNEEYRSFLVATGHPRTPWSGDQYPEDEARYPVTGVWWSEARAYAEWKGRRLPTETEWEVAGRGPEARPYSWGDDFVLDAPRAHLGPALLPGGRVRDVVVRPLPVDLPTGDVSAFGVKHLVGNVQEWVADPWLPREAGDPSASPREIATGLAPECDRVVRGSSFDTPASSSLARLSERMARQGESPGGRYGFRCALSAPH